MKKEQIADAAHVHHYTFLLYPSYCTYLIKVIGEKTVSSFLCARVLKKSYLRYLEARFFFIWHGFCLTFIFAISPSLSGLDVYWPSRMY